jgi:hypothetical protein
VERSCLQYAKSQRFAERFELARKVRLFKERSA